jgi:hypothetical protein
MTMISYQALIKKPRVFKSVTGLDRDEFDRLFQKFLPVWVAQERERQDRPDRQRAIGGGRRYKLLLQDRLVMVLTWLRLYLNTEALGFFFDLNKSNVSRNCRRLLPVLRTLGDETLGWPEPPTRGKGKSVEEALQECPDLLAIVDTTEQRVRRPRDNDQQKQHYSGKKKARTQDRDCGERAWADSRGHRLDAWFQARSETRGGRWGIGTRAAGRDGHWGRGL